MDSPINNDSQKARHYRNNRLCPYNNRAANCTKDKANDPLGVCSIFEDDNRLAIICPVRFRQDWLITADAAGFFFPTGTTWTTLSEVRLNDKFGKSAGNIDLVLVAYDEKGHVLDFGALEVQAVYISGNIRRPFEHYMQNPTGSHSIDWTGQRNYPRPDYLSSSRKRLVPQLMYKGSILKAWDKKQAVALHHGFYGTLPVLPEVPPEEADIAWLVYDLVSDREHSLYSLKLERTVYTAFKPALARISTAEPGQMDTFVDLLQEKLDEKLEGSDNLSEEITLTDLL